MAIIKNFVDYRIAKETVQKQFPEGCTSRTYKSWRNGTSAKEVLPIDPPSYYCGEWEGWGEFTGSGHTRDRNYLGYNKAKAFLLTQFPNGISGKKYRDWARRNSTFPADKLPRSPDQYYGRRKEWLGWGDFGGTGYQHVHDTLLDYESAKRLIGTHFPRGCTQELYRFWVKDSDFPHDKLPLSPPKYYRRRGNSWKGWYDFGNRIAPERKGSVYVLKHPLWPEYVKIGKELGDGKRCSAANVYDPLGRFEYVYVERFDDRELAETIIHAQFDEYRVGGEWFKISEQEAMDAIIALKQRFWTSKNVILLNINEPCEEGLPTDSQLQASP